MDNIPKSTILCISNEMKYRLYFLYMAFPQFRSYITDAHHSTEVPFGRNIDSSLLIVNDMLDKIFLTTNIITIIIENNYVDRIYRDCYYSHFSGKHFEHNRYCKRVLIFSGDQKEQIKHLNEEVLRKSFLGSIVIKPIKHGALGKTLLSPTIFFCKKDTYIRVSNYNINYCGISLLVEAFPYTMQDGETLSCAEVTILNIMDYYSNRYSDYRYTLPSDIYRKLQDSGFERPLPTTGMSYTMISKLLFEFGFFPKLYVANEGYTDEQMRRILSYYVESAIPVAVGLRYSAGYNHSIICIGHGERNNHDLTLDLYRTFEYGEDPDEIEDLYIADTANAHSKIIVMDDNITPYSTYQFRRENNSIYSKRVNGFTFGRQITDKNDQIEMDSKIICIAVPLYKRMYMDAESARYICIELLKDKKLSFKASVKASFNLETGTKDSPLIMRLFLASSKTFLHNRKKNLPQEHTLLQLYKTSYFPRFIWVCELCDESHYKSGFAMGEIILDATASVTDNPSDSVISIFYPNLICSRVFDGKISQELINRLSKNDDVSFTQNGNAKIDFAIIKNLQSHSFHPYPMFSGNLSPF